MESSPESALSQFFGHPSFRPGQAEIVDSILAGHPTLAVLPTGGGKSLCYQLPALLLDGLTIVISPLIALMKDQVDTLTSRGIAAARLDSSLAEAEVIEIYNRMASANLKLLYMSPERFGNERFFQRLRNAKISLLAIDEAHCISEWGHNFRPEYLRIAALARRLRIDRILALTATATPPVIKDIGRAFRITKTFKTSFHRRNLAIHITPIASADRLCYIASQLGMNARFPAIVYVTLQHTAESVAAHLQKNGLRARAYHAGFSDDVRASVQEDFMEGRCDIIVATIAFGMGIDKADIRSVYHFNLPKTLENYQQEIGRAGRDGLPSHCELLACPDDLTVLRNFTLGDTPDETSLSNLVHHLLRQGAKFDVSRYDLSRTYDIRPLVLETIFTYLEKHKLLAPDGSFYRSFRIAFRHPEDRVIAGHTPARQRFLKSLFAAGKRGRSWLTLDVDAAAELLGESRERILKALTHLEEAKDIEVKATGIRHRFKALPTASTRSPHEVAQWLHQVFARHEQQALKRTATTLAFAEHPGCSTQHLLAYFGENLDQPCGHCCACLGRPAGPLPQTARREISLEDLAIIRSLRAENHPALAGRRALARFLCGMTSPATSRDRLTRHNAFGLLEDVPFEDILGHLDTLL